MDTNALRQALQARAMQISPEVPEGIPPEVVDQFQNQPPPDMPVPPQGMPAPIDAMGGDPMAMVPPEIQAEMEKLRVKESFKRIHELDARKEADELYRIRMQDVETESNELFEPKKSKSY